MTALLALAGATITLGLAAAAFAWAIVSAGAAVDHMRREEREQWSDDSSEWLGFADFHGERE